AAALGRPMTVLFGESAAGFSSGEEDMASYHETILGLQETRLRPALDFIDQFILDKMTDSANIFYKFPSIDVPNANDDATKFNTFSGGVAALVNADILSPRQAAKE